jgi:hypothetical protein
MIIKFNEYQICLFFFLWVITNNPPSCVSPDARGCTLYMTQLDGFFLRKIFSEFFSIFFSRLFFKNIFSRIFYSLSKTRMPLLLSALIRLYTVLNRLISFFSKKISLSRDKASELSQVERTPTCIVSLMLRFVVSTWQSNLYSTSKYNFLVTTRRRHCGSP